MWMTLYITSFFHPLAQLKAIGIDYNGCTECDLSPLAQLKAIDYNSLHWMWPQDIPMN